ncbi:ABC transporter substrate-binding protein [Nocardioides mangrovicus]|uniref:ABC transporter substrate-binding protein n=2 Tax=Nocardioides mangrovicus TaxID=2478913 RepID=A0A3L8P5N7_9ACTN|nr:ABC transporter substrate-binding protein [Nocardioides mangrovicus]
MGACYAVQPRPAAVEHADRTSVGSGGRQVQQGGDLVMGLSAEPDVLDPTTSSSLYTRYVMSSICEKLYDLDAKTELVPQLASALPTLSDGGLTVTIPLRQGIEFADGTKFDAAAVKTTLQRDLTKKDSARASEMGPVQSIDTPDDHTVVLHYKTPFAPITAALADRAGMIMSPAALKKYGDDFGNHPTCVGPFRFVKRVPQTEIVVRRDPRYYDAKDVHLDTITYRIMTDANIRAANLRSGQVQVIDTVSAQDVDALRREPGIGLLQVGSLGYQGVTFNVGNTRGLGKPPGKIDTPEARDARVRRAFELSVDRTALVNSVFNNWAEPACSGVAPDTEYATTASNHCPAYDPKRARQLLRAAGVRTPLKLTMTLTNTPDTLRLGQALQAMVKKGGFDLRLQAVEYSTLLDQQDRGDFDLLQLGWSGRIDPHGNLYTFLATEQGNNVAGYSNKEVDALLAQAAQQTDPVQRGATYGQAVTAVQQDDPIVYLYRQRNLTAYSTDVTGISAYADGVVRLGTAAFVKGAH